MWHGRPAHVFFSLFSPFGGLGALILLGVYPLLFFILPFTPPQHRGVHEGGDGGSTGGARG
jgi:hypothetical protein